MKRIPLALSLLALVNVSATASTYISLGYGSASPDDITFETAVGTIDTDFDDGELTTAAIGKKFGDFRFEFELLWHDNDVNSHRLDGGEPLSGSKGTYTNEGYFINALYDFHFELPVVPYLGVGLGYTNLEIEDFGVDAFPDVMTDEDSGFAYQAIAGVSYDITDNFGVYLDYRYMDTENQSLTTSVAAGSVKNDIDYQASSYSFGLRYTF